MDSRKIQRSGNTYYLYLPASWCREHKITTDSVVFLEKSSSGNLVVKPKKTKTSLTSLKLELDDSNPELINKMITASYINPVKEFHIDLKKPLSPDQILDHKKLLGGLELVEFEEKEISCHTSIALSDPDILLQAMIRKILSIAKLMKQDPKHELVRKYEEEIDKSNMLIHKSIITTLMYRRESGIKHINLFYIGMISRITEQIADLLITTGEDKHLINKIENMMEMLSAILEKLTQDNVTEFVKAVDGLDKIEETDLQTYKKKRLYALLGHIAEILCDWLITEEVDKNK
ncbi:hypothetical protein JXC34_05745 [Candidatus Woesearchaeota archaeon]|nr:hypothetical protein [Candidatus Woesearchaeota archaeon]